MANYDRLAQFYDSVMGDREEVITILKDQIAKHNPQTRSLLELGCGTGSLLEGLGEQYERHGIDLSPGMLDQARLKLPNAHFYLASIADFDVKQQFNTAFCVFDTINHLTNLSDWRRTFVSTHKHLVPNGLFIFDMNTIGRMQALAHMPTFIQDFDDNTMYMDIEAVSHHEVEWHVTIQETQTDGAIQVHEEFVHEASFPLKQVEETLADQNFEILEKFDSDYQLPTDNSDRIYYICRKI